MKKAISLIIILALFIGILSACTVVKERFEITFVGNGKSDCSVISIDDTLVVADTSLAKDKEAVWDAIKKYGKEIDILIISRYDEAALGNAKDLIKEFKVKTVYGPKREQNVPEYLSFREALKETETEYIMVEKEQVYQTKNGNLSVFPTVDFLSGDPVANDSLMTTVMYKGYYFLLTGNAGGERLDEFSDYAREEYDLIKLPYNGEMSRQLRHFLNTAEADGVIISAPEESSVPEALTKKLTGDEIQAFYTFNGNIYAGCDSKGVYVTQNDKKYYPDQYETETLLDEVKDEFDINE